jgi:putative transposase
MKKSNFTENQIVSAIKKQENGMPVKELARELGISEPTFYNWKARYGGMEASDLKRLRDMEVELREYKRIVAELTFENRAMKGLIEKKL